MSESAASGAARSAATRAATRPTGQAGEHEQTIGVLVVDDQATVRDGLVTILELTPGIEVVGAAADGAEALAMATATLPDVVLMDLGMPVVDGVGATTEILAALPATRILVLTTYVDDVSIRRALDAGAAGYLTKSAGRADIVAAIRSTAQGQNTFAPEVTRRMLGGLNGGLNGAAGGQAEGGLVSPSTSGSESHVAPGPDTRPGGGTQNSGGQDEIERLAGDPRFGSLTEQERRVLALVLDRRRNPEIAAQLYVSVSTVKTHINNLFAKLGVRSRDEAIALVRSR